MAKKSDRTNVMRILEQRGVPFEQHLYDPEKLNAVEVAQCLGQDPARVFKTLVTVGKSGAHFVFMVPSGAELDLKKAARAAGEKALEMIPQKALLPLTGYVHGGCSPIGMKRQFRTFVHETAEGLDFLYCSGGRVGDQVRLSLEGLRKVLTVEAADLVKD